MRIYRVLLVAWFIMFFNSCKSTEDVSVTDDSTTVIASFADQVVTMDELKSNFYRNRNPEQVDSSELKEFFPSFINYRLKLYEGYQKGFHEDSTILAEYNKYTSEIAYRHWSENEIKKERINRFKDRFQHELKAFHILKELPEDALPADTADVYQTLVAVRDSLLNGATPEEMNQRHSSRRNGNPMGGELSWITAGSTILPFENALYDLEPGEISFPVRSQFGYHLILLEDIRPRTPPRLVRHIFVRKNQEDAGRSKIQDAFSALEADTSWSEVVSSYSDDPSSKTRDGLLGWVGYGTRFPPELVDAAMITPLDSSYSEPVEVSYGYHIMKIDSVQNFNTDEQLEEFIVNRLKQLDRLEPEKEDVYERIANISDLLINRSKFNDFSQNETKNASDTEHPSEQVLIHFNGKDYTNGHFQEWLNKESTMDDVMKSGDLITSYRNDIIRENLVEFTKQKIPEFERQTEQFMDDLIVFKVNEEFIWNPKAVEQEKLKAFYESNIDDYIKEKTYVYTEISSTEDSLIQTAYQQLKKGTNADSLDKKMRNIAVYKDSISYKQSTFYQTLKNLQPGEFSEPLTVDDRSFILLLQKIREERILSFDEAYNMVFSDYQPIHEHSFLDGLKEKYDLKTFPEHIE